MTVSKGGFNPLIGEDKIISLPYDTLIQLIEQLKVLLVLLTIITADKTVKGIISSPHNTEQLIKVLSIICTILNS